MTVRRPGPPPGAHVAPGFAALAVTLALVGIVGLLAYTTVQRSREIADRRPRVEVVITQEERAVLERLTKRVNRAIALRTRILLRVCNLQNRSSRQKP